MTDPGPSADDLTDAQVAAVQAAADEATSIRAEITARDPSVRAVRDQVDELAAATRLVVDAYRAAGVSTVRAERAATCWLIDPRGPRADLAAADAGPWRRAGDGPGGLGQGPRG